METMKNGFYSLEVVSESSLPVYDFTKEEDTGISMDLWTKTDLMKILNIKLSEEEQKTMVRGFIKTSKRMNGFAALFSLSELMDLRFGHSYKISKTGPWDTIKF